MSQPSERTEAVIAKAVDSAYHKTKLAKLKSKFGMKLRTNAKPMGKKALLTGVKQVPIAGPAIATVLNQAMTAAEKKYKQWKAAKLKKGIDATDDFERSVENNYTKAALKAMKTGNPFDSIDTTRKKLEMSSQEFNQLLTKGLENCKDCVEVFYHYYRVKVRATKLKIRIGLVQAILERLDEFADNMLEQVGGVYDQLVDGVNTYQETHQFDGSCSTMCLNTAEGHLGFSNAQLHQPLLVAEFDNDDM